MGRMGWDRCNRQSINSKLKLKMICLKADEPVEDLLVAFFCHTGSSQALWSFRASTKSNRTWGRAKIGRGLLEKKGFWGWEKEKTTFLNLRIWNYYTLPRMPVTTRIIPFFNFLVGNLNLNLCENWCFAVLLLSSQCFDGLRCSPGLLVAKLGEMECGQFVGKVWHVGKMDFFRKPLKFKQICCLQERNS